MRPRIAIVLTLTASVVSAWLFRNNAAPNAVASTGRVESDAGPSDMRGEDWSMSLNPSGEVEISYKGSTVAESSLAFWGPDWKWLGKEFELRWEGDGRGTLRGRVPDLKTELVGSVQSTEPNVLTMDLQWTSTEDIAEAIGGGWGWKFKLDAPAFGGSAPAPELLEGGAGWVWKLTPDQTIALRFDPSPAKVYNDAGRKNSIRTFFLADRVERAVKRFRVTLSLPEGASRTPSPEERYGPVDSANWFVDALTWDASPVDLRFLNKDHRPAGRDGFVKVEGDRLTFGDGTPARFWGANLAAYAIFSTPRETVPLQARRMAQLGYNLMRIHHHDSDWVKPNIFGDKAESTRRLDPASLEALDWWIKCLKDEGIYVWLDLEVGRQFKPADQLRQGVSEIIGVKGGSSGLSYYNTDIQKLWREFQQQYLNHVNPHTKLAYKDDPAIMGVLITNENDLVNHYGNALLPDKNRPFHNALFTQDYKAFAQKSGLPEAKVFQTWLPGPSKIYLNDAEHRFNAMMIDDLRAMGLRAPIATTNFWGRAPLFTLPALSDGDVIDAHSYGEAEALGVNPRYEANFIPWTGAAQVAGKPLTITEWNVPYPAVDRFTAPLYTASMAALQSWDAPMLYNYSQEKLSPPRGPSTWSTYSDPALTGVMPAAALLYRRGHVSPAQKTYYLDVGPELFFGRALTPETSATIRTLVEQSRLTIGLPEVKELPWLKPTKPPEGAIRIDDPDRDMIPPGQFEVRSDTGELTRDWKRGIHVVDAPKTQAISGWIGGEDLQTADADFRFQTKKAVVALSSVDDEPLSQSRFILVTAIARVLPSDKNRMPMLSEPTRGTITLKTDVPNLQLLSLAADGKVVGREKLKRDQGTVTIRLPSSGGTHWYAITPAADDSP